jgi:hypothetical protein
MSQRLTELYCTSVDESLLQVTWTWKFTRNKSKTQTLVDVDAVDPPCHVDVPLGESSSTFVAAVEPALETLVLSNL